MTATTQATPSSGRAPGTGPTVVVPFAALRRFFLRLLLYAALIGGPAAIATYFLSNAQPRVYLAEATLLAPTRAAQPELDLLGQPLPVEGAPLLPRAYGPALRSADVLEDAWHRLNPDAGAEPTTLELRDLADSVRFRFETPRRSTLITVGAKGATPVEALARANTLADSLVAWDDARARAAASVAAAGLEAQLDGLEEQIAALRSSSSRANLPQIASLSVLTATLREDIAAANAGAVGARGTLEFLRPAPSSTRIEPSPLVDAAVVFALVTALVMGYMLVRRGLDRRVRGVEALANFTGLPVLADLAKAPHKDADDRRDYREIHFLKAHIDRALGAEGELLVVSLRGSNASARVAAALQRLYTGPPRASSGVGRPPAAGRAGRAGAAGGVERHVMRVTAGPPLLSPGASAEQVAAADGVLLVVGANQTDRSDLGLAVGWLERSAAPVLGLVTVPDSAERAAA